MRIRQIVSISCVVLTAWYTTAALLGTQPVATNTAMLCSVENKTNPQPLTGALQQTDYRFTHTSDVDSWQQNRFSHMLKNDHPQRWLPAKWVKAHIEFDRIAIGGCGRNEFDTTLKYTEDPDGPVDYGPLAQHHKLASVYVIQTAPATTKRQTAPKLTSRIFAVLESQRVDFTFTTFISDGVFHYEAQNNGSQDVPFSIPALTSAWAAVGMSRRLLKFSGGSAVTRAPFRVRRPCSEIATS